MFKTGLTALIGVIIFQTGAFAQVYVKNTGFVGIGVQNPTAKLELPNNGNASFRVGVSSNMSNAHTQLINSLTVIGDGRDAITASSAVAYDFYNNGNSPTWAGTILYHYGIGLSGYIYPNIHVDKTNLGVLHFQNESNGLIVGSSNVYISAGYGTPTTFLSNGNVGIGMDNPQYKLHVNGIVKATAFNATSANYPDYVFDSAYQRPTLQQIEAYIKQNHHLPEVPSTEEVERDGLNLGEHQVILLKKIEELTLYAIEQNKKQQEQNEKLLLLEEKLTQLLEENNRLKEDKTKKKAAARK
jgi:hypothetical protein